MSHIKKRLLTLTQIADLDDDETTLVIDLFDTLQFLERTDNAYFKENNHSNFIFAIDYILDSTAPRLKKRVALRFASRMIEILNQYGKLHGFDLKKTESSIIGFLPSHLT